MMKEKVILDPALKAWLDNVVVPILVQDYLENEAGKTVASETSLGLDFATKAHQRPEGDP